MIKLNTKIINALLIGCSSAEINNDIITIELEDLNSLDFGITEERRINITLYNKEGEVIGSN